MQVSDSGAITDALERLLTSPQFAGAFRASSFLRYVVEAALAGHADRVKEYVLGVDVFDRATTFDPRIDTIVRVEAVKLRKRITAYYRGPGRKDPIVISLPRGGYVPHFETRRGRSAARPFPVTNSRHVACPEFRRGPGEDEISVESIARLGYHLITQQRIAALSHAAVLFRECTVRKPEHAPAYLGLAECTFLQTALGQLPPAQSRRHCVALAERARALEPQSADMQLGYARLANCYEWNWESAETGFRRAVELAPDSAPAHGWYGGYLTRKGDVDRGIREIHVATALDPVSSLPRSLLGDALYLAEDFHGSAAACADALVLHPNDWLLHSILSKAYVALGDRASALMHVKEAARACSDCENVVIQGDLAYVLAVSGRKDKAHQILVRLERRRVSGHVSAVILARICTALGREDDALGWLERGCDDRDIFMNSIRSDIRLAPLRRYARFRAVIAEMRF